MGAKAMIFFSSAWPMVKESQFRKSKKKWGQIPAFPQAPDPDNFLIFLFCFPNTVLILHCYLLVHTFRQGIQFFLPHDFICSGDRQILGFIEHRQ